MVLVHGHVTAVHGSNTRLMHPVSLGLKPAQLQVATMTLKSVRISLTRMSQANTLSPLANPATTARLHLA